MIASKHTTLSTLSDEDLMGFVQKGREAAFSELVIRYKDRLHNFLFRYTKPSRL